MNSVNHPSDFVVDMQTLDRIEDSVSVASDTGPVLKSAVPNVTSAPGGTKFGKGRRQVGFRNSVDDDETFRKVAWKGHSTPFRSTYREEFTAISIGGSQGCYAPPSALQWDYHDLGFPSHNIQTPVRNHSIPQQIGVQQTPTGQGRQLNHPSMPVLNNQTEQGRSV